MAPKLGSGARFKKLEGKLAKSGASNPAALAASIGRKKYGEKKMSAMAQHGKNKKHHEFAKALMHKRKA